MIDFNGKFFKLLTIIFLVYLVYLVVEDRRSQTVPIPEQSLIPKVSSGAGSKYTVEIDPTKPASQQSFFEKAIQYIFATKIEQEVKARQQLEQYNMAPKSVERAVINGDVVKIVIKNESNAGAENVEPKLVVVGGGMLDKTLEEKIISMRVGEIKTVEADDKKYRIELLDINPVESLNKKLNQKSEEK